jgi:hypothetical protein
MDFLEINWKKLDLHEETSYKMIFYKQNYKLYKLVFFVSSSDPYWFLRMGQERNCHINIKIGDKTSITYLGRLQNIETSLT